MYLQDDSDGTQILISDVKQLYSVTHSDADLPLGDFIGPNRASDSWHENLLVLISLVLQTFEKSSAQNYYCLMFDQASFVSDENSSSTY